MANSSNDALRMLLLIQKNPRLIGISMGGLGLATRILGPIVKSYFVFASLNEQEITAPGQPKVEDLLNVYHFKFLNPQNSYLCPDRRSS